MTSFNNTNRDPVDAMVVAIAVESWLTAMGSGDQATCCEGDIALEAVLRFQGVLNPADVEIYFEGESEEHDVLHMKVGDTWFEVNRDGDVAAL